MSDVRRLVPGHGGPTLPRDGTALWISLLLTGAILLAFHGLRECNFINLDDPPHIQNNPHIRDGLTWKGLKWACAADLVEKSEHTDYWQPVTIVSRMVDIQLFGLDAGMHHWMNLMYHLGVALLLFHTLRGMTGSSWRSAFVAALFALHPTRVESLAWVVERKDLLAGLFWVLAIRAWWRYTQAPSTWKYLTVMLCFALGLMSKPMVMTLPCVLLLLDYWPLNRLPLAWDQRAVWGRRLLEKAPLLILTLGSMVVTWQVQGTAIQDRSAGHLISNALASFAATISLQLAPIGLSFQYPRSAFPLSALDVALDLSLLVVLILAIRFARPWPWLLVGWLWFLGTQVPVLFLDDVVTSDRFSYIPCMGLYIAVAWGFGEMAGRWKLPRVLAGGAAVSLLLLLGVLTQRQIPYWRNGETLGRRVIATNPRNALGHFTLGLMLVERGDKEEGTVHLAAALRLNNPLIVNHPRHLNNLGVGLGFVGRREDALECYIRAIELDPTYPVAHFNYGTLLKECGRTDEALREFRETVRLKPAYAAGWYAIGNILREREIVEEAVASYRAAVGADPTLDKAHNNLAICLAYQGKLDEAVRHYQEALRLNPAEAAVHCNLAAALARLGRKDAAVISYHRALRFQPGMKRAQEGLDHLRSETRQMPAKSRDPKAP